MLRFFIDSADRHTWEPLARQGWVHGVTTNPTLIERAGLMSSIATAADLVRAATDIGLKELHLQSWGGGFERLGDNGRALAALAPIVTVKVPATPEGLEAAALLKAEGHRVTLTACYTVRQCAAARVLGLDYVAPYYGRMIEAGIDADARLDAMKVAAGDDGPRILIASIRRAEQIDALLGRGFDTFTLSPAVAEAVASDAASSAAAEAFEAAARRPAAGGNT